MLSFLFALILSPVLAAPVSSCEGGGGVVSEVRFQGQTNCDLAAQLSRVFNEMAGQFGEAPSVRLVIGGSSGNASFDNGSTIQIPMQLVFSGSYGGVSAVPASSLYVAAAHEYGHAIFHQKLRRQFPEYSDLFAGLAKLSDARWNGTMSPEQQRSLYSEIMKVPEHSQFMRHLTAYAELYADVVTVFQFQDPSAMFKALYYDAMTDFQYHYVRMRDFSSVVDGQWEHLLYQDHAKLAYVRVFIGQKLWPTNAGESLQYEQKIAAAVFAALGQDLKESDPVDYQLANEKIIHELQKTR